MGSQNCDGYLQLNREWFPAKLFRKSKGLMECTLKESPIAKKHDLVSLTFTLASNSNRIKFLEIPCTTKREEYKRNLRQKRIDRRRQRNKARFGSTVCKSARELEESLVTSLPIDDVLDEVSNFCKEKYDFPNVITNLALSFLFDPEEGNWYRFKYNLGVYEKPTYSSSIIWRLGLGTQVFGVEIQPNNWLRIKYENSEGWINMGKLGTKSANVYQLTFEKNLKNWGEWILDSDEKKKKKGEEIVPNECPCGF